MTVYDVVVTVRLQVTASTPDDAEIAARDAIVSPDSTVRVMNVRCAATQSIPDRVVDVEAARHVVEYRRRFAPSASEFDLLYEVHNGKFTPVSADALLVRAHYRVHTWSLSHLALVASRITTVG